MLLSFVFLSCDESPVTPDLASNAEPEATAAAAAPITQPFVKAYSFAHFRKDTLEYCSDVTLTIAPPEGLVSGWNPEKMYNLRESLADFGTELNRSCSDQFADRPVLATCAATIKNTLEHSALTIFERYYDSAALGTSDRHMKECLHLGGEWKATTRPSIKSSNTSPLEDVLRNLRESTTVN